MLKFFRVSKKISRAALTKYLVGAYALFSLTVVIFALANFDSYLGRKKLEMKSAAYEIEFNFANTLDYTESVLNYINRKIALSNGNKSQINKIFKSFNGSHGDYGSVRDVLSTGMFLWIDDRNLLTISSEYGLIKMPLDVSNRDYLAHCEKTPWKIFTGSPTIGAASGQYVIPAGVGVVDEDGRYFGTTAVGFKVYALVEKFEKLVRNYGVDFAILDNHDKVLMESVSGLFSEDHDLLKNLQFSSAKEVREGTLSEFKLFNPRGSYVIMRNFEKYPYKVLISAPNGILVNGASKEIWPHLIELLIITIFFSTLLYFVRILVKD